jgi:phosphatidate cytidylyltransferase
MGRVITGLGLAIAWLLLLFVAPYMLFSLVITAGGGVALYEFLQISSPEKERKYIAPVIVLGISPMLVAYLWGIWALTSTLFLALLLLVFLTVAAYTSLDNGLFFIARNWFGIFYIGFCSAHLILLRSFPQGIYWLLVLTAITVFSDTGAYYVGRLFGKVKLYPALSPGKTRAGAVGGVFGGLLGGLVVAAFAFENANLVAIGFLSAILSIIGIVGDLIESLIKRVAGVKDSGQILPGHGGLLDRCDSLLLTAPVLYYVLYWGQTILFR